MFFSGRVTKSILLVTPCTCSFFSYDDDKSYETKGILLAAEYFLKQGHKPYIVLRLSKKSSDNSLMKKGLIVPARKKGNIYDDEL